MKILGVDTGTLETGWAIYDTETHTVPFMGVDDNEVVLNEVLEQYEYDVASLEMVASYGMPVGATTFETVYWIGRFAERAEAKGKKVVRYYKKTDINPTICFNSKVKDTHIRRAILDFFPKTGGGKEPSIGTKAKKGVLFGIKSHIFPALAVALTHALKNNIITYKQF